MSAPGPGREELPEAETDLPWIGAPAANALAAAGITRLEEVARLRERELLALHGVGPKAVKILRAALQERGLDVRP